MSKHKQAESNAVVSTVAAGGHRRLLAAGLVLLLLVAGGWFVMQQHRPKAAPPAVTSNLFTDLPPAQRADALGASGNYAAAQALLAGQAATAPTKQAKADIYVQQATLALNASSSSDARHYAAAAEAAAPTDATASLVAKAAAASGDKTTARAYIQKALDRLDKKAPWYPRSFQEYQEQLQAVDAS